MRKLACVFALAVVACGGGGPSGDDDDGGGCPPGQIACNGTCVDPEAPATCGACGHTCGTGESCDNGTCIAACTNGVMFPGNASPLPARGEAVAIADLDGDGIADAIVDQSGGDASTQVFVMKGNGRGFTEVFRGPSPSDHTMVAAIDIDGDGDRDVVAGRFPIVVYRNDGAMTFTAKQEVVGVFAEPPLVGDFDGDGRGDLMAIDHDGGGRVVVVVLAGQADTTFARKIVPGIFAYAIAAGDVDKDGDLDLAILDGTTLKIFTNTAGTFTAGATLALGGPLTAQLAIIAGDIDGDGAADFAIRQDVATEKIVRSDGAGGLRAPEPMTASGFGDRSLVDVDGDQKADLVVTDASLCIRPSTSIALGPVACRDVGVRPDVVTFTSTELVVLDGESINIFPRDAGAPTAVVGSHFAPVPGDVDGDGDPELVVPAASDDAVRIVDAVGGVPRIVAEFRDLDVPASAAVVDLDGGAADVVIGAADGVHFYHRNNTGWAAPVKLVPGSEIQELAVGKFDGDSMPDILLIDNSRLKLYHATAPATYAQTPVTDVAVAGLASLVAADVDGDNRLDAIVVESDQIVVRCGTSGGPLAAPQPFAIGSPNRIVVVADVDGDGKRDLVTESQIARGNGDGTFQAGQPLPLQGTPIAVRDVDGDGTVDIVQTNGRGVRLLHGGAGGFTLTRAWRLPNATAAAVDVVDLDDDGNLDLVTIAGGIALGIAPGDATGFALPELLVTVAQPDKLATADFDEDGRTDILVTDRIGGAKVLLARDASFTESFALSASDAPLSAAVRVVDADADGHVDLVLGANLWRGDGTGAFTQIVGPRSSASQLATVFANADNYVDLASLSQIEGDRRVWFGGPGGFTEGPELPRFFGLCGGDLDGDGRGDIGASTLSTLGFALGDGAGGFANLAELPDMLPALPGVLACADLDRDGIADLAAATSPVENGSANVLAIARGAAGGPSAPSTIKTPTAISSLAVGDLGSGRYVITTGSGWVAAYDLAGTQQAMVRASSAVAIGDADGDRHPDFYLLHDEGLEVIHGACR